MASSSSQAAAVADHLSQFQPLPIALLRQLSEQACKGGIAKFPDEPNLTNKQLYRLTIPGSTPQDMVLANNNKWFDDEIVNRYLELMCEDVHHKAGWSKGTDKTTPPFVQTANSFFYNNLQEKGPTTQTRYLKRLGLDNARLLQLEHFFIPYNENKTHWILIVISPQLKMIGYLDSFAQPILKQLWPVIAFLRHELGDKFVEDEWTVYTLDRDLQSSNVTQCGVFLCTFATNLTYGFEVKNVKLSDLSNKRLRIASELLNRKISPVTSANRDVSAGFLSSPDYNQSKAEPLSKYAPPQGWPQMPSPPKTQNPDEPVEYDVQDLTDETFVRTQFDPISQRWKDALKAQLRKSDGLDPVPDRPRKFAPPYFGPAVARADLEKLVTIKDDQVVANETGWLSNSAITRYLAFICEYANDEAGWKYSPDGPPPPYYSFPETFYGDLRRYGIGGDYDFHSRPLWTKAGFDQKRFLAAEHIFLLYHYGQNHWILIVISPRLKRIGWFDSLAFNMEQKLAPLIHALRSELGADFKVEEWTVFSAVEATKNKLVLPRQDDAFQCGVFAITYAVLVAFGFDVCSFSMRDIPGKRLRVAAELLNDGFTGIFDPGDINVVRVDHVTDEASASTETFPSTDYTQAVGTPLSKFDDPTWKPQQRPRHEPARQEDVIDLTSDDPHSPSPAPNLPSKPKPPRTPSKQTGRLPTPQTPGHPQPPSEPPRQPARPIKPTRSRKAPTPITYPFEDLTTKKDLQTFCRDSGGQFPGYTSASKSGVSVVDFKNWMKGLYREDQQRKRKRLPSPGQTPRKRPRDEDEDEDDDEDEGLPSPKRMARERKLRAK